MEFSWFTKAEEVREAWGKCFAGRGVLCSWELQKAAEAARLESVETAYLLAREGAEVVALVPCYGFEMSLAGVAPEGFKRVVAAVRRVWKGFLQARMFVVGSPLSNYGDLLGFAEPENAARWTPERVRAIWAEVEREARRRGRGFILVKELEERWVKFLKAALGPRMFFPASLPTTRLALPKREGGYLAAIRTTYRNKLKKRKKVAAENGLEFEVVRGVEGKEEEILGLYKQVLMHSESVFEVLNREFFVEAQRWLGERVLWVLGWQTEQKGERRGERGDQTAEEKVPEKTGEKRLVSCEMILADEGALHPLYSGADYAMKRNSDLYFNAFYTVIEEAERRGCAAVDLGQTAYEVKAELGAKAVPLWVGVRHLNPVWHAVLQATQGAFFPEAKMPEREVWGTPPPAKKSGAKKSEAPTQS